MTPKAGTNVKALPYGATEQLTPTQLLDHTPYEGSKTPIQGVLEILHIHGDAETGYPPYTLYLVNGTPVEKDSITLITTAKELSVLVKETQTATETATFANTCHDENGRFCETHGTTHSEAEGRTAVKVDPAEVRRWAKDNGYTISDRGRLSTEIIAAHKKANRAKPQQPTTPKTQETKPVKPEGDFQAKLKAAKGSLSADLKGIRPAEYSLQGDAPGNKFNELEAQTRKVGEIIHNEIIKRITVQEPISEKVQSLKNETIAISKEIEKVDIAYLDRERIKDQIWGKNNRFYESSSPEEYKKYTDAVEKAYPGKEAKAQALREQYATVYKQMTAEADIEKAYTVAYRNTALQVLSEARNGAYGNFEFEKVSSSTPGVGAALKEAGKVYPDEWVAQSDNAGTIKGKKGRRGLHEPITDSEGNVTSVITVDAQPGLNAISTNGYYPVAIHEIGHRMEVLRPHIKAMEWTFWHRRQEGETPSKLQKMQPGYGYRGDELAVKDKYIDPYIGKIYSNNPKQPMESFQMGVQYLFGGSAPIIRDKDYAHFILGLLAAG